MIIYKTTNLIDGKIYIGQDKNNNPSYYGSGLKLIKAIKKYGRENFKKDILEECVDENHLNEREVYWIKYYNSTDRESGYNISEGSKEGDRKIGHEIAKNGIYNYWVSKYGEEEAIERRKNQIKKLSDTLKQIGTPLTKKVGMLCG
jgi:group I intron endonuclease